MACGTKATGGENSTGVLAPEAVEGFAAIGMPRCSAVVAKAMKQLGTPYPRDDDARGRRLDELTGDGSPFEKLDDQFYGHMKREAGGFEAAADGYAYRSAMAKPMP